jgi:dienelactone hydrolase
MFGKTTLHSEDVSLQTSTAQLEANLVLPDNAKGLVIFAHGSGSGRFSPRNRAVAATINEGGMGTLLLDLLTVGEQTLDERSGKFRFDIDLLGQRLVGAIDWALKDARTRALRIGLFGASTGAAAALMAAAARPEAVFAVVSRGGRPDLASLALPMVKAPTLLIVGGNDPAVMQMNEKAAEMLLAPHEIQIISGATHLFEEPGKLELVAESALEWFERHLRM